MAEYYGYVEREKDDYIDWNAVGQDVVKKLDTEADRRVKKKKELADAQQSALNVFDTPNIGENKTLNEVYLNNANQAKEQQLIWYKELTNGRMNPDEYARLTQNMVDDNKNFSKIVNQAQTKFTSVNDRIKKGTASAIDIKQMEMIQQYTDFNNTAFRVDPNSGKMVAIKKNPDGKLSKDPNDILSIQGVFGALGVEIDEYQLDAEIDKDVKGLAKKYLQVIGKNGIATLDDIRQNPDFKSALDSAVESQLVTPNNTASILTQYGEYNISFDVKDKGKKGMIYVDRSQTTPQAVITSEQEEEARAIVRSQYEIRIGKTETKKVRSSGGGRSNSSGDKKIEQRDVLSTLAKMYYGNPQEVALAAEFLRDYMNTYIPKYKEDNILRIKKTAEGLVFITNSEIMNIPFGGKNLAQFLEGARIKVNITDKRESDNIAKYLMDQGMATLSTTPYSQEPIEYIKNKPSNAEAEAEEQLDFEFLDYVKTDATPKGVASKY